jgi:hypothetical protein
MGQGALDPPPWVKPAPTIGVKKSIVLVTLSPYNVEVNI